MILAAALAACLGLLAWPLWDMRRTDRARILSTVPDISEDANLMNKAFLEHAVADLIAHPGQHTELW